MYRVTAHTADESQRFFHRISRTEFWWQRRTKETKAEVILEAEELRDSESGADRTKLNCRYVHSVIDAKTNRIEHLDGSIRAYTPEEMMTRLDVDLKRAGRQTEYTKLWRVDGTIEIGRWKSVIHNHFRDNALVSEYFGSQKSKADIREELGKMDVFPRSLKLEQRAPWLCDGARSFRILVTHQPGILEHIPEEPIVEHDGRPVSASSQQLTRWVGTESGKTKPVHISDEQENLLANLKEGLAFVCKRKPANK